MTLTERVTRKNYIVKIESKTVEAVKEGLRRIFSVMGDYKKIVKSITSDNGVEFSRLYELEEVVESVMGHPVKLVMGSYENIKLTTPEDLETGEVFVRRLCKNI